MMSIKIFQCPWDPWDRGYDRKRRERCKSRCRLLRRDPLQNRWSENINDVNMQPIYYNSLVFLRAGWQFSLKGVTTPDTIKHNRLKLWEARASIEQPTDPTVSPASCSLSSIKTLKWNLENIEWYHLFSFSIIWRSIKTVESSVCIWKCIIKH